MLKSALIAVMSFGTTVFASEASLKCELEAVKIKSSDSFLTSKIAENLSAESNQVYPGQLRLGKSISYGQDKTIDLYVSLNTKTGELQADIRPGDVPAMPGVFGAGIGRFSGKIQLVSQKFSVSSVLQGTIEEGFLKDREDEKLTEFDSVVLNCTYKAAK